MDNAFVFLETRVGYVYNRREEDAEHKGREHVPSTKTISHNEPPRAHPAVESDACSHAIVELTNDRDHILLHAEPSEYCPEKGSVNGVISFCKVDNEDIPKKIVTSAPTHVTDESRTSYQW